MSDNVTENVIEFLRDQQIATATFCQGRYVNKIKELSKKYPEEVQITAENPDGSIVAHFPTKWVKIVPKREMSEKQEEQLRKMLAQRGSKTITTAK